jgi:dipeptidyl aminopeptidase/acylaminoacyl peptidase
MGYGVLQINYRGSTGFGRAHELANTVEVAEKSVDDVVDGIRWAIEQGCADPKKIIAYGGSYGGYISLGIATRYPDLLAAAIGFAGVYDWLEDYKHAFDEWNNPANFGEMFRWRADYYLDPGKFGDRYRAVSPINFAGAVRCPVLLHHGRIDQTVQISQTNNMARALQKAGKVVEVTKDPEGIHGLASEKQGQVFYRTLATFLLKHVPPAK